VKPRAESLALPALDVAKDYLGVDKAPPCDRRKEGKKEFHKRWQKEFLNEFKKRGPDGRYKPTPSTKGRSNHWLL
jgi:hypothetical protein